MKNDVIAENKYNGLVSVVITTYKRNPKFLKEAIESVINQTYNDIEIIIVDDNGVRSEYQKITEKLIHEYKNIKYIANITNKGAQYSRNIGILQSNGEFVAFLDDDDVWKATKIEEQVQCFEDDDVGLVYCNGDIIHGDSVVRVASYHKDSTFKCLATYDDLLYDDCIGTTTQALVRRTCFASVGIFDPKLPARQDYEMWIRISQKWKAVGVPNHLFCHRIHDNEQISKDITKNIKGNKIILDKYRADYSTNKRAKAKRYLRIAAVYHIGKKRIQMCRYILMAFFTSARTTIYVLMNNNVR